MNTQNGLHERKSIRNLRTPHGKKDSKRSLGISFSNAATPTLSVNLDNTTGDTSIGSTTSLVIPPNYPGRNLSSSASFLGSIRSYPSIRNFNSVRNFNSPLVDGTVINNPNSIDTVDEMLLHNENNTSFKNETLVNDSDDAIANSIHHNNENNNLIDLLAESMYSYTPSIMNSGIYGKRPIVSNEIPNVFKINENTQFDRDNLMEQDKNFFILSSAGKPIFTMHGKDEQIISITGIINTIVSYFQLNDQTDIKTIASKLSGQKYVFLNKSPIILMAYSKRGETTNSLLTQLDFIYSYLLSSLTERQLKRFFTKRANFDLRTYLAHTDFENLNEICLLLSNKLYPEIFLNALQSNPLRKTIRAKIHETILNQLKNDSDLIPRGTLLYGMILSTEQNKLTAVIRPRGHTLYINDLQILFCLIRRHFQLNGTDKELWIPICFPKFNSSGFLYCYIRFLSPKDKSTLVLISAQKDAFFKLKLFADRLWDQLVDNKLQKYIIKDDNVRRGFRVRDIPAPFVHHFIYKSKRLVQYIMPEIEFNSNISNFDNNDDIIDNDNNDRVFKSIETSDNENDNILRKQRYEKKLQTYYRQLHDSVMPDNDNELNKKTVLNLIKWDEYEHDDSNNTFDEYGFQHERVKVMGLAWVTSQFELYMICNDGVDNKDIVLKSAKKVVNWCKRYEQRLFIHNGAIF